MNKESEYRANAQAALEMAARSHDDEFKAILLKVAQGWLELAERAENPKRSEPHDEIRPGDQKPDRPKH
jgi:hypothetical protein